MRCGGSGGAAPGRRHREQTLRDRDDDHGELSVVGDHEQHDDERAHEHQESGPDGADVRCSSGLTLFGAVSPEVHLNGSAVAITVRPERISIVEPGARYLDRLTMGDLVIEIDHVVRPHEDGAEVCGEAQAAAGHIRPEEHRDAEEHREHQPREYAERRRRCGRRHVRGAPRSLLA